jgi:hypothetical protein
MSRVLVLPACVPTLEERKRVAEKKNITFVALAA